MTLREGIGTAGLAMGRAFLADKASGKVREAGTPLEERDAFERAYMSVREDLRSLAEENEIFAAHLEMLEDPMLSDSVTEAIDEGADASHAVEATCAQICMMFAGVEDEYLRSRMDDVRDVCSRLEDAISGRTDSPWKDMPEGSIVVSEELLPSDIAGMDLSRVEGFVAATGSRTSHVCIMAGSSGIPAIVSVDISGIRSGDLILMDAGSGKVITDPSEAEAESFRRRIDALEDEKRLAQALAHSPAVTRGGTTVPVLANAGSIEDVGAAIAAGADGIGLLRTEFVFMHAQDLPSEEEQYGIYRAAAEVCGDRPLTIRTLDIGGDKPLPYLQMPREANPFLGVRGIRFSLRHMEVFATQMRAILRASVHGNVRVMFPMIAAASELAKARECLRQCMDGLRNEGIAFDEGMEVGMMVETPAAVLDAETLAAECDFFSIGTNDLTQYLMAADRGDDAVAYADSDTDGPVSRAVEMVVSAAHKAGIKVGMCGEMASDPARTGKLVATGLDEFSVAAPAVAAVKEMIRRI